MDGDGSADASSSSGEGESVEALAKRAMANVKKNGGKVPDEVKKMAKAALKSMDGGKGSPSGGLKQKPIASIQKESEKAPTISELTDRVH